MSTFERRNYSDQLNIETPEQVAIQFHVAGIGSRFVAVLIDHVIETVSTWIIFLIIFVVLAGAAKGMAGVAASLGSYNVATKWAIAFIIFVLFCLHWGYFALFEAFWKGQTPGKRIMKLRVIKDSGRQITLFESLARNLLRFVDFLPSLYLVGVITMLCNKGNKRLGDYAAGTLVIHEARQEQPLFYQNLQGSRATPFAPQASFAPVDINGQVPALFPADAIARLTSADLRIIDTFFGRALDLSLETRQTMAMRVAREMTAKMGVPVPEMNPERVLESIAVQMRGNGRRF